MRQVHRQCLHNQWRWMDDTTLLTVTMRHVDTALGAEFGKLGPGPTIVCLGVRLDTALPDTSSSCLDTLLFGTSVFTSLQGLIVNLCIFWVLFQCYYVFINFRNIKIVTLKLHLEIWYLWDLCQDLVFFTHSRAHVQFWSNFVKISRVIWLKQLKADIECDHLNQCCSFDLENVKDKEISDFVITSTCI